MVLKTLNVAHYWGGRIYRLKSFGSTIKLDQVVIGLDNFATGHQYNLDEVKEG